MNLMLVIVGGIIISCIPKLNRVLRYGILTVVAALFVIAYLVISDNSRVFLMIPFTSIDKSEMSYVGTGGYFELNYDVSPTVTMSNKDYGNSLEVTDKSTVKELEDWGSLATGQIYILVYQDNKIVYKYKLEKEDNADSILSYYNEYCKSGLMPSQSEKWNFLSFYMIREI